jgi:hypothetical protein
MPVLGPERRLGGRDRVAGRALGVARSGVIPTLVTTKSVLRVTGREQRDAPEHGRAEHRCEGNRTRRPPRP